MRVELKYYSKRLRYLHSIINILLLVSIFVLIIVCETVSAIGDANNAKLIAIIGLSLFGVFAIFNFSIVFVYGSSITRISKVVTTEIRAQRYDAGIEYLTKVSQKKNFKLINQTILFQLGYLELLKDNVTNTQYYFEQYDTSKILPINAVCTASIALLLSAIYINNNDTDKLKKIKLFYKVRKAELIRTTRNHPDIILLYNIIECINDDRINDINVTRFINSRYYKIPLLRRFIEKEPSDKNLVSQEQGSNS